MEPNEIREHLYGTADAPNKGQGVRHLMWRLKKEDSDAVLSALLGVFFGDSGYEYQEAAGGLLWKLKPRYTRDLRDDITRSLKYWNVSVEELPWYFAEATGIHRVRAEVNSIPGETLDEISKKNAQTYLYWLSRDPGSFRAELEQKWDWLRG